MFADALKYIDEIGVRINSVQAARNNQTLDDSHVLCAELSPAEVPHFAAHGDGSERAFQVIGIDSHIRVAEEYLQPYATRARVLQCLGEHCRRPQPVLLELSFDPVKELLYAWFGMCQSI